MLAKDLFLTGSRVRRWRTSREFDGGARQNTFLGNEEEGQPVLHAEITRFRFSAPLPQQGLKHCFTKVFEKKAHTKETN